MAKLAVPTFKVPGYQKPWEIRHLIFDLNGTLSVDGALEDEVKGRIMFLREKFADLNMYLFTGDTLGNAGDVADYLKLEMRNTPTAKSKADEAEKLCRKREHRAAIGNGLIDVDLFHVCGLRLAIIQKEGASAHAIMAADMVFTSVVDAIDFLLKEKRFTAGLRQ